MKARNFMAVISPDDVIAPSLVKPLDARPTNVEIQHGLNGGWLELVPGFDRFAGMRCVAFCDEEGKLKRLPVNQLATALWHEQFPLSARWSVDALVGPVVVVAGSKRFLAEL